MQRKACVERSEYFRAAARRKNSGIFQAVEKAVGFFDSLYRCPERDAGTFHSAFLNTVSGAVMTTRVLSATDPVKKALPPTTECSPITVAPPRMDAPE